jgi:ATP-dependent Clp protease ATP-binding subunit ClpC
MFEGIKITSSAEKALSNAEKAVRFFMGEKIEPEHILYGLSSIYGSVACEILKRVNISDEKIFAYLKANTTPNISFGFTRKLEFSEQSVNVIKNAKNVAMEVSNNVIGTEHILYAILDDASSKAVSIIEQGFNVRVEDLKNTLLKFFAESKNSQKIVSGQNFTESSNEYGNDEGETKTIAPNNDNSTLPNDLLLLGRDLTAIARSGKIGSIIGRGNEIQRVIEILCRKTKNNPCLVGEAGVGKSAVIEGLALAIVNGTVPNELKDKTIFSLDVASLISGTKYRGSMEEKLKKAIDIILSSKNIIVFIDEIHTLVQAGTEQGEISPADILKPYLARGEMQTIGATTLEEYEKFIEKDKALERRFQKVLVDPPTKEDTIRILQGIKSSFENYHKVVILDEAIDSAVELSDRYITDRNLPDKAIDLIDEASSRAKVINDFNNNFDNQEIKIGRNEIAEVVSKWTKIPVTKISQSEQEKLLNLENILHQRIIGQNEAVSAVCQALKRSRIGLQDKSKPIGSFLFLGQTGVGKTELSKALAEVLFDDENSLIRIDMSEYMDSFTVSKLIGAPPGYAGYDDGGELTEEVRRHPYSVVLFDEIEKANPDVLNILLQILDDGRLTDGKGRLINFKNTIIIMTSNLGMNELENRNSLGFNSKIIDDENYEDMKNFLIDNLKKHIRLELLNRIDSIVVFHKLNREELRQIAILMLNKLNSRLKDLNLQLEFTPNAIDYIVINGIDEKLGARPLKRFIQNEIETPLADKLLKKELNNVTKLKVDVFNNQLIFDIIA